MRFVAALLFLAIASQVWVDSQRIHSKAGPFRVIPDHVENCPLSLFPIGPKSSFHFRGRRDRKNADIWYYSGNYSHSFVWDDELDVEMNMASWSSRGGWKDNAFVLKLKHLCITGKTYVRKLWRNAMQAIFDDPNRDCPVPPGNYTLRNATADLSITSKVPAFFYGKWRLDVKLMEHPWVCISCMRIFLHIVPRTNYGSQFGAAEVEKPAAKPPH